MRCVGEGIPAYVQSPPSFDKVVEMCCACFLFLCSPSRTGLRRRDTHAAATIDGGAAEATTGGRTMSAATSAADETNYTAAAAAAATEGATCKFIRYDAVPWNLSAFSWRRPVNRRGVGVGWVGD